VHVQRSTCRRSGWIRPTAPPRWLGTLRPWLPSSSGVASSRWTSA